GKPEDAGVGTKRRAHGRPVLTVPMFERDGTTVASASRRHPHVCRTCHGDLVELHARAPPRGFHLQPRLPLPPHDQLPPPSAPVPAENVAILSRSDRPDVVGTTAGYGQQVTGQKGGPIADGPA